MHAQSEAQNIIDCEDAAESVGLTYACVDQPGIERRRSGKGFSYRHPKTGAISDGSVLSRIRSLAVPPAWRSVWICSDPNGHIQAFGYDERGRKQYIYHPKFREAREDIKFEHMLTFAEVLPRLRKRVAADLARCGLGRAKVLATVVQLLETTMIRVGNDSYAKENGSYGLTTLRQSHAAVESGELKLHFKGKGGKLWRLGIRDRRVIKIVKSCQELPGQHLFQYVDSDGRPQTVTSSDVNAYLKEAAGTAITAKDFRTWAGTLLAAKALIQFEIADDMGRAVQLAAARLDNTPATCRKCYVHPEVINAYLDGGLLRGIEKHIDQQLRSELDSMWPEEAAVLAFLRERVERDFASARKGYAEKAPSIMEGITAHKLLSSSKRPVPRRRPRGAPSGSIRRATMSAAAC
jgi:DNA topoisomerase I